MIPISRKIDSMIGKEAYIESIRDCASYLRGYIGRTGVITSADSEGYTIQFSDDEHLFYKDEVTIL